MMRTANRLLAVCAFLILTVLALPACSDKDVRDDLAPYYITALSGIVNTCGEDGPMNGTQLPVGLEAVSATTFNFALGAGTKNPLLVPDVAVDADGNFAAEISLEMGPDSPPGILYFSGVVTPDELFAELILSVGWEDENGMFVEFCRIELALTGPPCDSACNGQ